VNLPVPSGSGDGVWCSLVEHVVAPLARAYEPQLILISAGYDAHIEDPLGSCTVSEEGFAAMAGSMARVAGEIGAPLGGLLEGGYAVEATARSVLATLGVLGAAAPPAPAAGLARDPLAEQALARLSSHWPALASA
jgi:acetoin utilization deacetylase AcuC-like enzyme